MLCADCTKHPSRKCFSSRQARSALDEMQQLLTNMCCNITAELGAKNKNAKCIQMRVEEGNSGRQ